MTKDEGLPHIYIGGYVESVCEGGCMSLSEERVNKKERSQLMGVTLNNGKYV